MRLSIEPGGCHHRRMAGTDHEAVTPSRHEVAIATVRAFAAAASAGRVVALLDEGAGSEPTMLEWAPGVAFELTVAGQAQALAPESAAGVAPLAIALPRAVPPTALTVDVTAGELAGPIGAVAGLAAGVRDLARAFGGRSVVTADFATRDPGRTLTIAAREGEPLVVAVGDDQFAMPDGWPG